MGRKNIPINLSHDELCQCMSGSNGRQQPSDRLHSFTREPGRSVGSARARGIEDITKLDYLQMLCENAPHARVLQTLWSLSGHFTRIGMALSSPAKASNVNLTARSTTGPGVSQCRSQIHPLRHCGTPQLHAMLGLFSARSRIHTQGRSHYTRIDTVEARSFEFQLAFKQACISNRKDGMSHTCTHVS